MTKKDYIALADTLNRSVQTIRANDQSFIPLYTVAQNMCDVFARDNPRFDRMKFLKASGLIPA